MPSSNSAPRMSAARRTGPAVLVCVIVFACERHLEQATPGARVATVEVTPPTATVPVGQTVQLTATPQDSTDAPLPDRPVTWTSDNPAIVSVDVNGLATGKTPGSATITATSEGKSGVSYISVTEIPSVPVASVTVSPPTATVEVDQTVQLTATPKDANGSPLTGRTVTWSSSATAVAIVNGSGLVTGRASGAATITATSEGQRGTAEVTVTARPPGRGEVLVGAGDIADCGSSGAEATAALLDAIPGTVFTAGDNAYSSGTASEYANCYDPTWGRHKARTRPAPGNHEYNTSDAAPYYAYFGANAGPSGRGYYSYDLGDWHLISLNSNIDMSAGSAQELWLRADLAATTKTCVLAYWHHPRFSSGSHGSSTESQPLWQALYDYNADVVVVGHDHNYQRFAPQTPSGAPDPVRGMREFVAGTGGRSHYSFSTPIANTEAYNTDTWGVLKLTLDAASYSWEFIPIAGGTYRDSGTGACH
ncbi:MAG: alkaline phosphatase [Gemmatimonadetes bacterium]|nr:MAG: alkaline phosphatase [Gemmatimonadota bacterium]PYP06570.1 MAG: alkaline phosphatase [Gemmatimonadota bacterium]